MNTLFDLLPEPDEVKPIDNQYVQEKLAESRLNRARNDFQSKYPASYIRELEIKMLPSKDGRRGEDSAASALTPEERLIYADFLESKNQPLGAKAFREYKDKVVTETKTKTRRRK